MLGATGSSSTILTNDKTLPADGAAPSGQRGFGKSQAKQYAWLAGVSVTLDFRLVLQCLGQPLNDDLGLQALRQACRKVCVTGVRIARLH